MPMNTNIAPFSHLENQGKKALEKTRDNVAEFDNEFFIKLEKHCNQDEIDKFNNPDNFLLLGTAREKIARINTKEKRRLIEYILINKVKKSKSIDEDIAYNKALEVAIELSDDQKVLLVILEIISPILCSAINDPNTISRVELLTSFINESVVIHDSDIALCQQRGLLYSLFPKELDIADLFETNIFPELIMKIKSIYSNLKEKDINLLGYSLHLPGSIIANIIIEELGVRYTGQKSFPTKFADFVANNIMGLGAVSCLK